MRRRSSAVRAQPDAAPPPVPDPQSAPEHRGIEGYRVIRTLGVGSRARVLLANVGEAHAPVAIKAFEPHVSEASIAAEVAACEAAQSLHVVKLLDVSFGSDVAPCVILERMDGGTLAAVLRARERIRAGEGVTIMVSVLRGIRALHAAGFAHSALSLSAVHFDRAGRPVIIGLGHAVRLAAPGSGEYRSEIGADWERYRTLTRAVLDRVEGEGRTDELARIERALDQLVVACSDEAADSAETALFALDQPAPVRLDRGVTVQAGAQQPGGWPRNMRRESAVLEPEDTAGPSEVAADRRHRRRAFARGATAEGFAVWAEGVWDAGPIRTLIRRLNPLLRARKKQLMVAGVVAGVVAIAGLTAVPSGTTPSGTTPSGTTASVTAPAERSVHSPAVTGGTPQSDPSRTATVSPHVEDPVTATTVLLAERARCLATASLTCLNAVDQADSAQLAADRAALQPGASSPNEAPTGYSSFAVSLIQRTGDSALVELTPPHSDGKPASALVIKGEAGWRLRQIFEN